MAKIKKLKENGVTIYPATIPEALVDTNGFSMADFMDRLLDVLAKGGRDNLDLAFSDLQTALGSGKSLDMYLGDVNTFIEKVNSFLEDADASDTTINRWKEIESFLAGITDTKTLTGLLEENLASAKSYTDSKVLSSVGNAVTMASNAEGADRILVSGGADKTAKDSGIDLNQLVVFDVAEDAPAEGVIPQFTGNSNPATGGGTITTSGTKISDLAKKSELPTAATTSKAGLMSAADKAKLDGIAENANNYTLPAATASALGGVKSGGNITVGSDGTVTVNKATAADAAGHATQADNATYATSAGSADSATKATQDGLGRQIDTTYATSENVEAIVEELNQTMILSVAVTDVTEYAEIAI